MKCLILLILVNNLFFGLSSELCKSLIKKAKTEGDLIKEINDNFKELKDESETCIELLLETSHYKSLERYVKKLSEEGIKFHETLSNSISIIKSKLDSIKKEFQEIGKETKIISPAFQWAQSLENVYLEVVFGSRFEFPSCLEVENLEKSFEDNKLILTASCSLDETLLRFELKLNLLNEVNSKESLGKFSNNGKYQIILKKKEKAYWKRLLADENEVIPNMKVWFEMKTKFEDELAEFEKKEKDEDKSFEEIEKEILAEKKKKRKGKKGKKKNKKKKDL